MCVLLYCSGAFRDQDGGYVCVCMFRVVYARYGHLSGKQKNNTRTLITDVPSVHKKWDERSEKKKSSRRFPQLCSGVVVKLLPIFFPHLFCAPLWICLDMRGCTPFATASRCFCTSGPYLPLKSRKFLRGP